MKTGLKVLVRTTQKTYEKGIKAAKEAIEKINIKKHGDLGQLNYTILPELMKC